MDILPYLAQLASRNIWWDKVFSKSEQPLSQRIILATESVSGIRINCSYISSICLKHRLSKTIRV